MSQETKATEKTMISFQLHFLSLVSFLLTLVMQETETKVVKACILHKYIVSCNDRKTFIFLKN
jgi:hypothetical protein